MGLPYPTKRMAPLSTQYFPFSFRKFGVERKILTATKPAAQTPTTAIRLEGELAVDISRLITLSRLGDEMKNIEATLSIGEPVVNSKLTCLSSPPHPDLVSAIPPEDKRMTSIFKRIWSLVSKPVRAS